MVSEFLQPIHEGMDDGQDGPSMKGAGPTWQGRVLRQETIVGESAELRVLKGLHANADELCFWLSQ